MSEYDAAVANARFDGWASEEREWKTLRNLVVATTQKLGLERTPPAMNEVNPYWIVLFKSQRERQRAQSALHASGVETRLWWGKGLHHMEAFRKIPTSQLATIDSLSSRYLGLPYFIDMTKDQIERIAHVILSKT